MKEFFDRFCVFGKVVGMGEDYTEKKNDTWKNFFPDFQIHFLSLKIDLQKNTIFIFFYFFICFRGHQMPTLQKIIEWAKNL